MYACTMYVKLNASHIYMSIYVSMYIPYMYVSAKDRYRYRPLCDRRPVGVLGYDQVAVQALVLYHLGAYYSV